MDVNPIRPTSIQNLGQLRQPGRAENAAGQVGQTFEQALQALGQSQNESDALLEKLAAGESVDLHQVMIAAEQTDINFRIAIAIRDRLVDAYREITRMSV
jgi:flagellar hook-basal body complex protein FliE